MKRTFGQILRNFSISKKLIDGDRVALSRAITLIESYKAEHSQHAYDLLQSVLKNKKNIQKPTFRIGIAGPPGAGKSTFIDSFGSYILRNEAGDNKVAVLAIDPSSSRTGGSILGDMTRMDLLSHDPSAFVRPSPTSGKLGGIAAHTNDVITLCECANYNIVIVETVGLGQSEILIDEVVDFVIMLTPPQMGDDLQGVKKGIMEIADMVVVNKCDGPLETVAKHAQNDYKHTFQMLRRKHKNWRPRVKLTSAMNKIGIEEVWKVCQKFKIKMEAEIQERRVEQQQKLLWSCVYDELQRKANQGKIKVSFLFL